MHPAEHMPFSGSKSLCRKNTHLPLTMGHHLRTGSWSPGKYFWSPCSELKLFSPDQSTLYICIYPSVYPSVHPSIQQAPAECCLHASSVSVTKHRALEADRPVCMQGEWRKVHLTSLHSSGFNWLCSLINSFRNKMMLSEWRASRFAFWGHHPGLERWD